MSRKFAVLGIMVLVLVGMFATAGVAAAQEPAPAAGPCGVGGAFRWGPGGLNMLTIAADELGLTVTELREKLSAGATLKDLAEGKDLVAAVVAARKPAIDAAVASGRITQEQADTMLQTMTQKMTERLESGQPCGAGMQGGRRGAMKGGQMGSAVGGGRWGASKSL